MTAWTVERLRGTAADLHARVVPDDGRRRLWVLEATGPAVVLGSTQPTSLVDADAAAAAGVAVARRRSGGGAVWVAPDEPVWIDVFVPRGDPLWSDDVGAAFQPVGDAWARALDDLVLSGALDLDRSALAVHGGALVRTAWSATVCFAGLGPGEVLLGDRKLVGMSQRRTRAGARFQCAVPRSWDPEPLRALLTAPIPAGALDRAGAGIGHTVSVDTVVDALVGALSTASLR